MPGDVPDPDDPARTAGRTGPPGPLRSASSGSPPQPPALDRLADLVADGAVELPADLSDREQQQLLRSVRQRLRRWILEYIARQVALDLWREARTKE